MCRIATGLLVFNGKLPIAPITTGFEAQGSSTYTPVHVINLEVKDNHEEATLGAFLILELCEMVSDVLSYRVSGGFIEVWVGN